MKTLTIQNVPVEVQRIRLEFIKAINIIQRGETVVFNRLLSKVETKALENYLSKDDKFFFNKKKNCICPTSFGYTIRKDNRLPMSVNNSENVTIGLIISRRTLTFC